MEKKELSFEEAYTRLEEIAGSLENPEISLDDSVALFEEGIKLSKYCSDTLERAKQKIEVLKGSGEAAHD